MMETLKFNTQICTTIEQSKRLLELGLKPNTADMCWVAKKLCFDDVEIPEEERYYVLFTDKEDNSFLWRYDVDCVPAWSLHRLITMFPYKVNKSSNDASLLQITRIKDNCYHVGYIGYKVVEMPLFEAVIRLIEELIKDNIFNKEYLI